MFLNTLVRTKQGIRQYRNSDYNKVKGFHLCGPGLGDMICMQPVVDKVAKILQREMEVWTLRPEVFKYHPKVKVHFYNEDRLLDNLSDGSVLLLAPVTMDGENDRNQEHLIDHSAKHLCKLLPQEKELSFYSHPDEKFRATRFLKDLPTRPIIMLHPTKNVPIRTWPYEKWKSLIELLVQKFNVLLVGRDYYHPQLEGSVIEKKTFTFDFNQKNFLDLTNQLSIHTVYELIKRSDMIVTTDTGILHLAACTQTKTLAMFTNIHPMLRMRYRHGKAGHLTIPIFSQCSNQFCDTKLARSHDVCPFGRESKKYMQCLPSVEQVYQAISASLPLNL